MILLCPAAKTTLLKKALFCMLLFTVSPPAARAFHPDADSLKTKIILLGTGNPYPNAGRFGPATAVGYGKRFFCLMPVRAQSAE